MNGFIPFQLLNSQWYARSSRMMILIFLKEFQFHKYKLGTRDRRLPQIFHLIFSQIQPAISASLTMHPAAEHTHADNVYQDRDGAHTHYNHIWNPGGPIPFRLL